jgi:hypothetical protein
MYSGRMKWPSRGNRSNDALSWSRSGLRQLVNNKSFQVQLQKQRMNLALRCFWETGPWFRRRHVYEACVTDALQTHRTVQSVTGLARGVGVTPGNTRNHLTQSLPLSLSLVQTNFWVWVSRKLRKQMWREILYDSNADSVFISSEMFKSFLGQIPLSDMITSFWRNILPIWTNQLNVHSDIELSQPGRELALWGLGLGCCYKLAYQCIFEKHETNKKWLVGCLINGKGGCWGPAAGSEPWIPLHQTAQSGWQSHGLHTQKHTKSQIQNAPTHTVSERPAL